jgi:hypothetical protein
MVAPDTAAVVKLRVPRRVTRQKTLTYLQEIIQRADLIPRNYCFGVRISVGKRL